METTTQVLVSTAPTNREVVEFVLRTVFYNHLFENLEEFTDNVTDEVYKALVALCPGYDMEVLVEPSNYEVKCTVKMWFPGEENDPIFIYARIVWDALDYVSEDGE